MCLSLGCDTRFIMNYIAYNQQTLISHNYRDLEVQAQSSGDFISGEDMLPGS